MDSGPGLVGVFESLVSHLGVFVLRIHVGYMSHGSLRDGRVNNSSGVNVGVVGGG